jgi:hypothetical protein
MTVCRAEEIYGRGELPSERSQTAATSDSSPLGWRTAGVVAAVYDRLPGQGDLRSWRVTQQTVADRRYKRLQPAGLEDCRGCSGGL